MVSLGVVLFVVRNTFIAEIPRGHWKSGGLGRSQSSRFSGTDPRRVEALVAAGWTGG
jgi:hypothetical protein